MKIIKLLKIALLTILIAIVAFFGWKKFKNQSVSSTEAIIFQKVKELGFQEIFVKEEADKLTIRFELEQLDGSLINQMTEVAIKAAQTETTADQVVVQSYFLHEPLLGLETSLQKIKKYVAEEISLEDFYNQIELEDLRSVNSKLSTDLSILNFTVDNIDLNQQRAELDLSYQQPFAVNDFETTFWNDYLSLIAITLKNYPDAEKIVTNIDLLSNTKKITISAHSNDIVSFLDQSISPDQFAGTLAVTEEKVIKQSNDEENNEATFQEVLANYYQALKDDNYQQAATYLSSNLSGYWDDYSGDAVVASYDILYIKEESAQSALVHVEELLVGYDNSTSLNYLDYTLIKESTVWKIDDIKEVEKNDNTSTTPVTGSQTNQAQLSVDAAISTVGNFLNLLKQNKPQEAKQYSTDNFVKNQTPGLFTEYSLFNELEVIETKTNNDGSIMVKVRETWESGISIADYKVTNNQQEKILISSRILLE